MWTIRRSLGIVITSLLTLAAGARAQLPAVEREFRGLWIATVGNIDWPSKPNLTTSEQKAELISILDRAAQLNLNVIILQIRPDCDAMYDSKIEPWSEYLTGQMGRAPKPYYDPLAFAVEEAHKRGLELHAWLNPYRAGNRDAKTPIAANHVTRTHPGLVRPYGKYLWLDPTEPATRDYSLSVILDVVRRYDIDGIHFDDYFYPYPEKAQATSPTAMDFPDDASWARYKKSGGRLPRNDWRRENVDQFVRTVYAAIKREKPWVKFGISPFGIWQPRHPASIQGFDAFNSLFCDSRKWLAEGWVDYIVPQLYWPIAQKPQSFPVLLKWWEEQNSQHRLLCAGMRIDGWKGINDDARETADEIILTRCQPGASGAVLWHSRPLFGNHADVAWALHQGIYSEPALVPACPWLCTTCHDRPLLTVEAGRQNMRLAWRENYPVKVWQWVVRKKIAGHWTTQILPGTEVTEEIRKQGTMPLPESIAVCAVNRYGNLSEPAVFNNISTQK
jgi:uncharacterized lipoprotein YddW (UPF0748 family)